MHGAARQRTKSRTARHKAQYQYGKSLDADFGLVTFVLLYVYCGGNQRSVIAVNDKGEVMVNCRGVT